MNVGELYYLARRLRLLAEHGLGASAGQVEAVPVHHQLVLGAVLAAPGSSITEICERTSLAQSIVSKAVAALREQDLLVTETDPEDRRRVRVLPSARLASWAEGRLERPAESLLEPLITDLPPRDRACVVRALTLLHQRFQHYDPDSPVWGASGAVGQQE